LWCSRRARLFLRSVKAAKGRQEYLRLVENYREGDKIRQRVVLHVGRKDLLAPHLDALVRLLQADPGQPGMGLDRDCGYAPSLDLGTGSGSTASVR
jgi:hypothetical protein